MFARKVSLRLKPDAVEEFSEKLESEVIPLLSQQDGFQNEITLTSLDGRRAVAISLWDRKESAEAYERDSYPKVLRMLDRVTEGVPRVKGYEVANSTFHMTLVPARN